MAFITLSPEVLITAFLGGIAPACLWLYFWLTEDNAHPEPMSRILITFLAGSAATLVSLLLEFIVSKIVPAQGLGNIILVFTWAAIEEITKFTAAANAALATKYDDEPIDPLIYMITVALGFAAMENMLFLIKPLVEHGISGGIVSLNMRFIGATLLHIVASGTIGAYMSYAFYKSKRAKTIYLSLGLTLAITLHGFFNLAIISDEKNIIPAFALVWLAIIFLMYLFEKVKAIHKN